MESLKEGQELIHPQAWSLKFRVLSIIDLGDNTKEVEAYHIPYEQDDTSIYDHFSEIRKSSFMQQVQVIQTQFFPMPEAWYKVNYIVSLGFPSQLNLLGAEWRPPYAPEDTEPFLVQRLN